MGEGKNVSSELETKEQLFDVMEQIAEEREAAWPVVQELLARKPEELHDIEIEDSWRTAGFVQELSETAARRWQSDPLRSLPLQQLALVLAVSIRQDAYPSLVRARLEGIAWKEIGRVHQIQNAYDAALCAYRAAEACFEREEALVHDAARAKLSCTLLLIYSNQIQDVSPLIEESTSFFRTFGDERFLAMAEFARAFFEQQRGELLAARATYKRILPTICEANDLDTLAPLYHNLGMVYRDLGNPADAVLALQHARQIWADIEMPVEKSDWALAGVLLMNGEFVKALAILRRLRDVFLARRMPQDAGEVALDIVETLIATDRYAEARALTEQVIKEFVSAGLNHSAITALSYLRDLLPTKKEARRAVQHVRSHLQQLRSEPARVFLPMDDHRH